MVRNKQVISIYEELKNSEKYSDFFHLLPRSFIYDKIKEQTADTSTIRHTESHD